MERGREKVWDVKARREVERRKGIAGGRREGEKGKAKKRNTSDQPANPRLFNSSEYSSLQKAIP
jgi:hypothetical protein